MYLNNAVKATPKKQEEITQFSPPLYQAKYNGLLNLPSSSSMKCYMVP